MKTKFLILSLALMLAVATARAADSASAPKENIFETKPLGIQLSIKLVGPYMEAADLQIICLFRHKNSGDTYQGAAKDTDAHLGGVLSALRDRGEFVGELGETVLFTPPEGAIPAKRFMPEEANDLEISGLHVGPDQLYGQLDAQRFGLKDIFLRRRRRICRACGGDSQHQSQT